jgi:hypothetical protein
MGEANCTDNSATRESTGLFANLVQLLRNKEHGKTARTMAITLCVFGAIAAISAAVTIQRLFAAGGTKGSFRIGRPTYPTLGEKKRKLARMRPLARLRQASRA